MNIKMIGHSTVLIEIGGQRIITDPYFGKMGNIAFKRSEAPYGERSDYADSDIVLVSHIHFDHMDGKFFRMLSKESQVVLPRAMGFAKGLLGIKNAIGLKNYEKTTINGINITAVPAIHSTVTCGYIIEAEGKCIYFSGDTYHGGFMKELSKKYNIDIALMPVTTFGIPMTMGESGAVEAVRDLNPKTVIPVHLGLVPRSPLMRTKDSVEGFINRLKSAGLISEVVDLSAGKSFSV